MRLHGDHIFGDDTASMKGIGSIFFLKMTSIKKKERKDSDLPTHFEKRGSEYIKRKYFL
jgi:hypothetical protein